MFLSEKVVELLLILVECLALELSVVHLLAEVDHALEVGTYIVEVLEIIIVLADIHHEVEDVLLTLHWADSIDLIERILLENNEVDYLGIPELLVIIYWYTVVTQDIDLLLDLLTTLQVGLHIVHLAEPLAIDEIGDILLKHRILDKLRIRVDWVHSRVTLAVSTRLLQCVEAASHFLSTLSHRLYQVTTRRRYSTQESY